MKRILLSFYECEHNGDLDVYEEDIIESGGKIINSYVDTDLEQGLVIVEVDDSFMKIFKEIESYQYLA